MQPIDLQALYDWSIGTMKIQWILFAALIAFAVVMTFECSHHDNHENNDGVKQALVEQDQAPLKNAAKKAGGDWSKLTPWQKQQFLDRVGGNEDSAKTIFEKIARDP